MSVTDALLTGNFFFEGRWSRAGTRQIKLTEPRTDCEEPAVFSSAENDIEYVSVFRQIWTMEDIILDIIKLRNSTYNKPQL